MHDLVAYRNIGWDLSYMVYGISDTLSNNNKTHQQIQSDQGVKKISWQKYTFQNKNLVPTYSDG